MRIQDITRARRPRRGFSLVEMLVVISVIGILAAVAIPVFGRVGDKASQTIARRNAQNTATVSGLLSAVGIEHVLPESLGGAEATTRLLRRGIVDSEGNYFGVPNLQEDEVPATAIYLDIIIDPTVLRMIYDANG